MKGKSSTLFEIFVYNDVKGDRSKVGEKRTHLMDLVKVITVYRNNH